MSSAETHTFNITESNSIDSMPSFFIAETLKYLLLTFAPEQHLSLHDFTFTTEAHPLRQLYTLQQGSDDGVVNRCADGMKVGRQQIITPVFVVTANLIIVFLLYGLMRRSRKQTQPLIFKID